MPFVDLPDLGVAVQLLDRVVLHEAVAAEQVDRERRDALGDFGREDLADRRLREERPARVAQARGVVDRAAARPRRRPRARASWCCTAWNSAIGLPNCLRSFV